MSDSTPQEPTSQEQIYALQQELIQVREKGGDRTSESPEAHRLAECQILGKLGVAYYQGQHPKAIACFTSVLDPAETLQEATLKNVALAWLGCSYW